MGRESYHSPETQTERGHSKERQVKHTMCVVMALAGIAGSVAAEGTPLAVDGLFEDWDDIEACWVDPSGDGGVVDFGSVLVRSDAERITLLLDMGPEAAPTMLAPAAPSRGGAGMEAGPDIGGGMLAAAVASRSFCMNRRAARARKGLMRSR